jgi:hypothetical protein
MNLRVTAENAKKVQNETIPAFHAAFEQATAQTRVLLDAYASFGHRSHRRALSCQNQVLPAQLASDS